MADKIRTFIAISLPDHVLHGIGNVQASLKRSGFNIRWVRKEGIHLTLRFLGDVTKDRVEQISSAISVAARGFSPFTLKGQGVGVFPDFSRPRVVWVGISGDLEVLHNLYGKLESQLKGIGFAKEKRPLKGHLTVGRIKKRIDKAELKTALEVLEGFETDPFTAEAVILYQSTLRPQGAVYTKLSEVNLGV